MAYPVGAGQYKSAAGLAKVIAILLAVDVVLELAGGALAVLTIGVMRKVQSGEMSQGAAFRSIMLQFGGLGVLAFLVGVPIIVLFCIFMVRANKNARAFGSPMSNTPGWAAGWFFVPVAFWWKPYDAMKEIWQGSEPDPSVYAWHSRVSPLLPWWWAMWVLRTVAAIAGSFIGKGTSPVQNMIDTCQAQLIGLLPELAVAVLAAAVVLAVARRQDERQRRHPAGTPLPASAL